VVVHHEERGVGDRRRETGAAGVPQMAIVEMQPARPENLRREVELPPPVDDRRLAEEAGGPLVHLRRHFFGNFHEQRIAVDRELQVALVVESHR